MGFRELSEMLVRRALPIFMTPIVLSFLCVADGAADVGSAARLAVHVGSTAMLRSEGRTRNRGHRRCQKVEPVLQLRERYKIAVYTQEHDADDAMLEEGIKDHPMLSLEKNYDDADFVLWSLRGSGVQEEGTPPLGVPPRKLVAIDWSDGPLEIPYIAKSSILATFKRSFVRKKDGVFQELASGCTKKCFPFAYAVLNQYIDGMDAESVGDSTMRTIPVMCSLRPWLPPTEEGLQRQVGIARNRVLWWLHHDANLPTNARVTGLPDGLTHESWKSVLQVDETSIEQVAPSEEDMNRKHSADIGPAYKKLLRSAFVSVTANPAAYEGDHRLWEHFASGNAVLSDHISTPLPFPPIPGEHFQEFDVADRPGNNETFLHQLHQMLKGGTAVDTMACHGFQHALRHHRSVNRADYIVRTLAEMVHNASYTETGMQLRKRAPVATDEDKDYTPAVNPEYLLKIM